jgi:hypothetical protein
MTKNMKEQIESYQKSLQQVLDLIDKNKGKILAAELAFISKNNRINSSFLREAIEIGLITKLGRGLYKPLIIKAEPIHARKIIEARREYFRKRRSNLKNEGVSNIKENKNNIDSKVERKVKKKFSISFLWGLFQFSK